jgi:hypothetical protein
MTVADGQAVSWSAALDVVQQVEWRDLTGLDLEYWWPSERLEGDEYAPPNPLGVYEFVAQFRSALAGDLDLLSTAVTSGDTELLEIEIPGHRVFVTGGQTWGVTPTRLLNAIVRLADCGALAAAGITDASSTAADGGEDIVLIVDRRDGFTAPERRWAAAGRAVLYAEDDARLLEIAEPDLAAAPACARLVRLVVLLQKAARLLDAADQEFATGRSDSRYPGPGVGEYIRALAALNAEALHWAAELPTDWVSDVVSDFGPFGVPAREVVELLADDDSHRRERPLWPPSRWLARFLATLDDLPESAAYLDGQADAETRIALERWAGDVPLVTHGALVGRLIVDICNALGVLSPMGLRPFRDANGEQGVISPTYQDVEDGEPKVDVAATLAIFGIPDGGAPDWSAAERAAETAGLTDDLAAIRLVVTSSYHRNASSIKVPGGRIWVMGGIGRFDELWWDDRVRRLEQAGIIETLGATFGRVHTSVA